MKNLSDLSLQDNIPASPSSPPQDRLFSRISRRLLAILLLGLAVFVTVDWLGIVPGFKCLFGHHGERARTAHDGTVDNDSNKVSLETHVMSKCPDARYCLQQLVVPAMEQIGDKVDFKMSFIASVSNKSSEVICKHGPSECIGDILILCAINQPYPHQDLSVDSAAAAAAAATSSSHHESDAYPRTPTIRSLGFANCLISSYPRIPERTLVEECALEHGIDFDALNHCASQQEDEPGGDPPLSGIALLRKSALHNEELGISTSCTVRLDEEVWCVRDGGVWRDCARGGKGRKASVLVDEVKRRWDERNK